MRKSLRNALVAALAVFVTLFVARFAYLVSAPVDEPPFGGFQANAMLDSGESFSLKKNYASSRLQIPQASGAPQTVEQKYERVASLDASSESFDGDRARVLSIAEASGAVIQREDARGLPGSRVLSLSLGVTPERFEGFVEELKGVGSLASVSVVKRDKTAEYRQLEATRLSLENTRSGLRALRSPGAPLSDLMELETKILEIEGRIQELGVSLGDFAEGNSFCTVHYDLRERAAARSARRVAGAALEALAWSLLVCLGVGALAALALAVAALGIFVFGKASGFMRKH